MRSEHEQQALVIAWCELHKHRIPELEFIFAVPNGSNKSRAQAGKMRAEGLKAGVPDLVLPVSVTKQHELPDGTVEHESYGALYIEMKSETVKIGADGKAKTVRTYPTPEQRRWHEGLRRIGNKVVVCHTAEDAQWQILRYLGKEHTND